MDFGQVSLYLNAKNAMLRKPGLIVKEFFGTFHFIETFFLF